MIINGMKCSLKVNVNELVKKSGLSAIKEQLDSLGYDEDEKTAILRNAAAVKVRILKMNNIK